MKTTIKDIARIAEVAPSTVSRAINGRAGVSKTVSRKILKICEKLNYKPNNTARNLVLGETGNIGFMMNRTHSPIFSDLFYSEVLSGIELECEKNDYNLLFSTFKQNKKENKQNTKGNQYKLPKIVADNKVDGIILAGYGLDNQILNGLSDSKFPAVLIDNGFQSTGIDLIQVDNLKGGMIATNYLIDKGHRNIAYIGGSMTNISFRDRFRGFQIALSENNIKDKHNLIKVNDLSWGFDAMKELLKESSFTALFACNDLTALNAISVMRGQGIEPGSDIEIIGFDDIITAANFNPPLTTIKVKKEDMGRIAARKLFERLNNNTEEYKGMTTLVPVELVKRGTA